MAAAQQRAAPSTTAGMSASAGGSSKSAERHPLIGPSPNVEAEREFSAVEVDESKLRSPRPSSSSQTKEVGAMDLV